MKSEHSNFLDRTGTVLQGLPKMRETASAADLAVHRTAVRPEQANGRVLVYLIPIQPQLQTISNCFQGLFSKVDSQARPWLLEIVVDIVLLREQHTCVPYPTSRAPEG